MSDLVLVALIGTIPSIATLVLGILNRSHAARTEANVVAVSAVVDATDAKVVAVAKDVLETKTHVDGRMTELLAAVKAEAEAKEKARDDERADERADARAASERPPPRKR